MRPTHGTVGFEVVRRVIVGIEVCEVHVPTRVLDIVCGGRISPLCHTRGTKQVVTLRPDGRKEEELTYLRDTTDEQERTQLSLCVPDSRGISRHARRLLVVKRRLRPCCAKRKESAV